MKELGDDWTSGKLHEKYPDHVKAKRTSEDDKQRLTHVYPIIGHKRVADVTLDDCEAVMRELPSKLWIEMDFSLSRRIKVRITAKAGSYFGPNPKR